MEPEMIMTKKETQINYALQFFVTTCIVFFVGSIDYGIQHMLAIKWPADYVSFVDLCSVANISVIMFDNDLKGHYIHGKSPMGSADVSSEKLILALEAERVGKA